MQGLTQEQLDFLSKHKVDLKFVFNAQGLPKTLYRPLMKDLNKYIAYNVSPCAAQGHTLRTRSGHCCQCNTAHMAFQKRNDSSGIVYVAASTNGNIIKIGFTSEVEMRTASLNTTSYGGYNDWQILFALKSENAGRIETKANVLLTKYYLPMDYKHDGHIQDSHETFLCSYSKAKEILDIASKTYPNDITVIKNVITQLYEFRNLLRP